MLTTFGFQQAVEYFSTNLCTGVAGPAYIVELVAQILCRQTGTLLAEDLLTLGRAHDGETIRHVHIVVFVECRIVMGIEHLLDIIEYLG